jgi:hypothetical protein
LRVFENPFNRFGRVCFVKREKRIRETVTR